jgi:hypothetical protein
MTFVGVLETSLPSFGSGGAINTDASFTLVGDRRPPAARKSITMKKPR